MLNNSISRDDLTACEKTMAELNALYKEICELDLSKEEKRLSCTYIQPCITKLCIHIWSVCNNGTRSPIYQGRRIFTLMLLLRSVTGSVLRQMT